MADNDFLNGLKLETFMKNSSEKTSSSIDGLGSIFSGGLKGAIANQKTQINHLESIDKHVVSVNNNLSKIVTNQEKLMKGLLKKSSESSKDTSNLSKALKNVFDKNFGKEKDKDTFKREDTGKKTTFLLDKISDKLDGFKGAFSKKAKGLFGSLSAGLAGAGILGFLLTGDKNMLSNVARFGAGFLDKLILNPLKGVFGSLTKFFGEKLGKVFSGVASHLSGIMDNVMKSVASMGHSMMSTMSKWTTKLGKTAVGKGIKNIGGKIAGSKLGKFVGKWGGKALKGGKNILKAGKGVLKAGKKKMGKLMLKLGTKLGGKAGATAFKKAVSQIPIAGTLVSLPFAINRAAHGDWAGAALELVAGTAPALNLVAPFLGTAISLGAEGALLYRDLKGANDKGAARRAGGEPEADAFSLVPEFEPVPISGGGIPGVPKNSETSFKYVPGSTSYYYSEKGVDVNGVRDDVWKNYNSMFEEFNYLMAQQHPNHKNKWGMNGSVVQINSAYRSIKKQKALYAQYQKDKAAGKNPSPVAEPGRSMHNYGYALDINSPEANIMAGKGVVKLKVPGYSNLFQKYKIDRPVSGEPWHIEPKGLNYDKIRAGINNMGDSPSGGRHSEPEADAIDSPANLPQGNVARKNKSKAPIIVKLTSEDINALSIAFGQQMKENTPSPNNEVAPQNLGNPRSNL